MSITNEQVVVGRCLQQLPQRIAGTRRIETQAKLGQLDRYTAIKGPRPDFGDRRQVKIDGFVDLVGVGAGLSPRTSIVAGASRLVELPGDAAGVVEEVPAM